MGELKEYGLLGILFFFGTTLVSCGPAESYFTEEQAYERLTQAQWTTEAWIPAEGRRNPYKLKAKDFNAYQKQGQIHAQRYPVSVTGVLLPETPIKSILDNENWNPIQGVLNEVFKAFIGVNDFSGLLNWVGLIDYPENLNELNFATPSDLSVTEKLGYSSFYQGNTKLFTMSCATCHSDQLFGQTVLGMTKRFPRANDFFIQGHKALRHYSSSIFKMYTGATDEEMYWLERSIKNIKSVGFKKPIALGLDTSLAQVALSLNKREKNEWADKSDYYEKNPRADAFLDHQPGDSKPAVWWNVKYKNRWLSDGSVLSGNPIYTNLLWNEIGRGTDLRELAQWLNSNEKVVEELTTAIFSTSAPRIEQFFDANKISKPGALAGEKVFKQSCARCHGNYDKNWSRPGFANQPWSEQIKTYQVRYPQPTRVRDVGTDPYRYQSMKSLEILNDLQISKDNDIHIEAQKGYVPPPLVGIWARWPYLHNNSIPSLCALLTPASKRPKVYYAVAPVDKEKDFDFECNGYPQIEPRNWNESDKIFRTAKKGMSAEGHERGILIRNGKEVLSAEDKKNLILFLQTL